MQKKLADSVAKHEFDEEIFGFYKDSYETELEKRDKLLDRLNLAITQLTILGGILAYYLICIPDVTEFRISDLAFYIPCGLGILSFLCSLVLASFAAGRGFEYKYVPKTNEIAGYIESTIQENQNLPQEQREDIRGTFMVKLGGQYCECAASNWDINKSRTEKLSLIFRFAVIAIICAILAMPGYLLLKSHIETKPQDVRIVTQH